MSTITKQKYIITLSINTPIVCSLACDIVDTVECFGTCWITVGWCNPNDELIPLPGNDRLVVVVVTGGKLIAFKNSVKIKWLLLYIRTIYNINHTSHIHMYKHGAIALPFLLTANRDALIEQ